VAGARGGVDEAEEVGQAVVDLDRGQAEIVEGGELVLVLADRSRAERWTEGDHAHRPWMGAVQRQVLLGHRARSLPPRLSAGVGVWHRVAGVVGPAEPEDAGPVGAGPTPGGSGRKHRLYLLHKLRACHTIVDSIQVRVVTVLATRRWPRRRLRALRWVRSGRRRAGFGSPSGETRVRNRFCASVDASDRGHPRGRW
jgi:hypothetical protein